MTINSIRECPLQDPIITSTYSFGENQPEELADQAIHELFDRIFRMMEDLERPRRQNSGSPKQVVILNYNHK